jgi:hypothetical protein
MTMNLKEVADELVAAFPMEEWGPENADRGMCVLPFSIQLVQMVSLKDLIASFKQRLPQDARILNIDGNVVRLRASRYSEAAIVFSSKEWEVIPEGHSLPCLTPMYFSEPRPTEEDPEPIGKISFGAMGRNDFEFVIDKSQYDLIIPKHRETESSVTIIARYKR